MKITIRTCGLVDVMEFHGEASFRNVGELHDAVNQLVSAGEPFLIADLSGVTKLDSSWLGELVACRERARKHDGTIKVVVHGRCRDLFVASCLDRVFELHDDADEAIDSFVAEGDTAGVP